MEGRDKLSIFDANGGNRVLAEAAVAAAAAQQERSSRSAAAAAVTLEVEIPTVAWGTHGFMHAMVQLINGSTSTMHLSRVRTGASVSTAVLLLGGSASALARTRYVSCLVGAGCWLRCRKHVFAE